MSEVAIAAVVFDAVEEKRLKADAELITTGKCPLFEYVEQLRSEIIARDSAVRRVAINKLAFVTLNLPPSFLKDDEKFLAPRFGDLSHSAELLPRVVHFLVVLLKSTDAESLDRIFRCIFEENGIQAYAQADRLLLLEILEMFTEKFFNVIASFGAAFYTVFANAVSGERDPRCLMKVFKIFHNVMTKMDVGVFMEEMFELVACYYPIEYQPRDADKNPLTREALTSACEACLLSNGGFSFYVYQLLCEKLMEEEEYLSHDKKLEVCSLLGRACKRFGPNALMPLLDELLGAIRMLCLNPNHKDKDDRSPEIAGETLHSLVSAVALSGKNAEYVEKLGQNMLENIEPFVLQAEMGLSTKALKLLFSLSTAHPALNDMIIAKVFYWMNSLIVGLTVREQSNKEEICNEILALVPDLMKVTVEGTEGRVVVQANSLSRSLLTITVGDPKLICIAVSESAAYLCENVQHLTKENSGVISDLLNYLLSKNSAVLLKELSTKNIRESFTKVVHAVAKSQRDSWMDIMNNYLNAENWTDVEFVCCAALIINDESLQKYGDVFLTHLNRRLKVQNGTSLDVVIEAFLMISNPNAYSTNSQFFQSFIKLVSECCDENSDANAEVVSHCLQRLGHSLNESSHAEMAKFCSTRLLSDSPVRYRAARILLPFCLQIKELGLLTSILDSIGPSLVNSKISSYYFALLFSYFNRSSTDYITTVELSDLHRWTFDVIRFRSNILKNRQFDSEECKRLLINAPNEALDYLLDFSTNLTDPDLNGYKTTFLWQQRIIAQFTPCFVGTFNSSSSNDNLHLKLIPVLIPLLRLMKEVPCTLADECKQIFPILLEAIKVADFHSSIARLLMEANVQFLEVSDSQNIEIGQLLEEAWVMEKLLLTDGLPNHVLLNALRILEIISRFIPSKIRINRYEEILMAIEHTTCSKKREIRQKAANLRNLWELIPV